MYGMHNAANNAFTTVLVNSANSPYILRSDIAWRDTQQCMHIRIDQRSDLDNDVDDLEDFYQSLIDTAIRIMHQDDYVRATVIEFDACCYIQIHAHFEATTGSTTFVVTRGDVRSAVTLVQTIDVQRPSIWDDTVVTI